MQIDVGDIIQVVAAVASCIAAVAAFWECRLFRKQMNAETYLQQNAKSLEYAQFFLNQIIPKSTYINLATQPSGTIGEVNTKIADKNLEAFNAREFKSLTGLNPEQIFSRLKEEAYDGDSPFHKALLSAHSCLNMINPDVTLDISTCNQVDLERKPGMPQDVVDGIDSEVLWLEFDNVRTTLLNELELFAMAVNSGVADEDILFPSLHQVFFSITRTLYFSICNTNKLGIADRYYTHVTTLYLNWRKKYDAIQYKAKELDDGVNKSFQTKRRRML